MTYLLGMEGLALLRSVVKAVGADQQPQMAVNHCHSVGDSLRAAMAGGFFVRHVDGEPRPAPPEEPVPEPATEIDSWQDRPRTLLDLVPVATRAAWDEPAVVIWHLQLG